MVSNQPTKNLQKPKLQQGDLPRVSKENLPFKKGYKQNFADEIFETEKTNTLNPPSYTLRNSKREKILGKFYEPGLISVRKSGRIGSALVVQSINEYLCRKLPEGCLQSKLNKT